MRLNVLNKCVETLFPYLGRARGLAFGSKWLNAHGKLLIGSPEKLGLPEDGDPAVSKTFYYLRVDRHLPKGDNALMAWRNSQLYATQIREAGRPLVARNAALASIVFCAVVLAVAIPVPILFSVADVFVSRVVSEKKNPDLKVEIQAGEEIQAGYSSDIADWDREKCKALMAKGMSVWLTVPSDVQYHCKNLTQ